VDGRDGTRVLRIGVCIGISIWAAIQFALAARTKTKRGDVCDEA
jgi:hypothetical protein